jgi:hypothetical protein
MLRIGDADPSAVEMVVATFVDPREADGAASVLREAGVVAKVSTISTITLPARSEREPDKFGVVVASTDAREAIDILQKRFAPPQDDPFEIDLDEPLEAPPEPLQCPECGSEQIRSYSTVFIAIAAVLALMTVGWLTGFDEMFYLAAAIVGLILFFGPNHRCAQCGHRWME